MLWAPPSPENLLINPQACIRVIGRWELSPDGFGGLSTTTLPFLTPSWQAMLWFPAGVSLQGTGLLVGSISKPFQGNWKLSYIWVLFQTGNSPAGLNFMVWPRSLQWNWLFQWETSGNFAEGPIWTIFCQKKMLCLWLIVINRNAAIT